MSHGSYPKFTVTLIHEWLVEDFDNGENDNF